MYLNKYSIIIFLDQVGDFARKLSQENDPPTPWILSRVDVDIQPGPRILSTTIKTKFSTENVSSRSENEQFNNRIN